MATLNSQLSDSAVTRVCVFVMNDKSRMIETDRSILVRGDVVNFHGFNTGLKCSRVVFTGIEVNMSHVHLSHMSHSFP